MMDDDEGDLYDNETEILFALRLLHRAADDAYCHNYPGLNQPGNCDTCGVGQVIRATQSKTQS